MPVRPRLLLFLALAAPVLAAPKPEEIPSYTLGLDALSGRLWELAAVRFQDALDKTPELDDEARQTILLRLAEARVRGRQADKALEVLADPLLETHPARPFWTAQALAADGRFREAIDLLASDAIGETSPYRTEALLTEATLERAIGDTGSALATLDRVLRVRREPAAQLLKAEILLDRGQPVDAVKALPEPAKLPPEMASHRRYLQAEALLAQGDPAAAAEIFAVLAADPQEEPNARHQPLSRRHGAILGLARARIAAGNTEVAAKELLAFIQNQSDSPRLDEAFALLLDCLPAQPAPNDPILTRLREWLPQDPAEAPVILGRNGSAADSWPVAETPTGPIVPEAMFHLALGLRREGSPRSRVEARRLFDRLRFDHPNHPLAARALLVAGRWDLEDGRRPQAGVRFEALARLEDTAPDALRAQALCLEAGARFRDGEFLRAAGAFAAAAGLLEDEQRRAAQLNAASSLLAAGSVAGFDQLAKDLEHPALRDDLALERGLYLASVRSPEALPALRDFINAHPGHPRLPEARLSAAVAALDAVPPDAGFATTQLHTIATLGDEIRSRLPADTLALAEVRLHQERREWPKAAARAAEFLGQNPDSPRQIDFRYQQGRSLFFNKDYNEARLVLEKLAADFPEADEAPAALLFSARAAAEGATPQAQAESLALFDRLIESDSEYADVARIEKADTLISFRSRERLDEAIALLDPWFESLDDEAGFLATVGLLLGDALFARAEDSTELLERTLGVYDRLLGALPEHSPYRYRILLEKGRTLERLGRQDEALVVYTDVVQSAARDPRGDWESIESCGFRALAILESDKRKEYRRAKALALRIHALGGPRSEDAAEHAKQIGLQYMIFDNEPQEAEPEPDAP